MSGVDIPGSPPLYKTMLCIIYNYMFIYVQVIDLSGNKISRLSGLEGHSCLVELYLQENEVTISTHVHMHIVCK